MGKIDYSKYWTSHEGDTVGSFLEKWVGKKPEDVFIVYGERRITWKEVGELTARLATGLLDLGMKKGDRMGILGPNHPEVLISWFAAARVGIIPVPINSRYREMEMECLINDSCCKTLVTIDEWGGFNFSKTANEIREKSPTLKNIIVYGKGNDIKDPFISYDGLVNQTDIDWSKIEDNVPESSDILVILYTSGTTGIPKGVVHTHDSMLCCCKAIQEEVIRLTEKDLSLLAMPWANMVGHEVFCNSLLLSQKLVLMESYDPILAVDLIEKEKITWFVGVPTMFMLPIVRVPDLAKRDFSSFKFGLSGGFYAPPDQMKLFHTTYNIDMIQLLGSTEGGGMLLTRRDDPEEVAFNTLGRPVSIMEVKICDEKGQEVPRGEIGELWFRGPSVFKYYWNKPDETKREKDDQGYWHSGDMGKGIDEEGNIQLVGRKKEIIIRGGFNIFPGEIEAFALNMPEVQMAVLVGYPDKMLGEKTCLYIMAKQGIELIEEELRARFKKNIADYKMPDMVKIQSSPLPMVPSGKADKMTIRKNLLGELGLEDSSL